MKHSSAYVHVCVRVCVQLTDIPSPIIITTVTIIISSTHTQGKLSMLYRFRAVVREWIVIVHTWLSPSSVRCAIDSWLLTRLLALWARVNTDVFVEKFTRNWALPLWCYFKGSMLWVIVHKCLILDHDDAQIDCIKMKCRLNSSTVPLDPLYNLLKK